MKSIEITKAGASLAEYAKGLGEEPVVVTSDGRPVSILLNISDMDWETLDLKTLPVYLITLKLIEEKLKAKQNLSIDEVRWMVGVPPAGLERDPHYAAYFNDEADDEEAAEPAEELVAA